MAGAISGAYLGKQAIPVQWIDAVREDKHFLGEIEDLADHRFAKYVK
jgi:ADP-ribosylglycohydrolase